MKALWALLLGGLLLLSLAAAFIPEGEALKPGGPINPADVAWMLTATGLVLLMTPGLSFFYGGMVRSKNVISTMLQSFVAMGIISVVWVVVGFSLAFGESWGGLVGNPWTFAFFRHVGGETHVELAPTIPLLLFALFQLKFAIITPALITGSFAERVRFSSYLLFMVLFSVFIYAPLAHWTWHPQGFLHQWGVLDFAGGSVVHMSAGMAALAGAWLLGPRRDFLAQPTSAPANIPFVVLGTGMLWFGWFGFNAGSALAANASATLAFATTNTASACAMLAWIFVERVRGNPASAVGACVGAVVGLVAVTPAAGFVSVGASMFIGTAAALCSNAVLHWRAGTRLDDTLDVFPCHGVGGMVGMLLTAVFAKDGGLITGSVTLMGYHVLAVLLVSAFALGGSYLLYKLTNLVLPLRVNDEEERLGLDLSQHGESLDSAAPPR